MIRLRTLLMVTLLVMINLPGAARADQAGDSAAALAQARQIFKYADSGDFNSMYDLIHPDAMEVIPRVVAVKTFGALYGDASVGRGVPVGIEFGPWTWGVTGQTYENAAAVSYEQPYVDNGEDKTLESTMYLVQDQQGEWRWFFGGSRSFVDSAIAAYGTDAANVATGGTKITDGDVIANTVNDLDTFWRGAFSYTDLKYVSPKVVVVHAGETDQTGCGEAAPGFWAFYCPPDVTMYLDEAFLTQLGTQSPFAESFVIAHEWAHHIQTAIGLNRVSANEEPQHWNDVFSVELELMADCMAGSWAKDVSARGLMVESDIKQTVVFAIKYLGDPDNISNYDEQAHGSGDQRADAIMAGYNDGFLACDISI